MASQITISGKIYKLYRYTIYHTLTDKMIHSDRYNKDNLVSLESIAHVYITALWKTFLEMRILF